MGKYYKMTIDNDDNIHIIINKKGYGKDYAEKKKEESIIKNCLIQAILQNDKNDKYVQALGFDIRID